MMFITLRLHASANDETVRMAAYLKSVLSSSYLLFAMIIQFMASGKISEAIISMKLVSLKG